MALLLTLRVFVAAEARDGPGEQRRQLLKITRNHRTKDIEVVLPEADDVASLGWVPEVGYELSEDGRYALHAVAPSRCAAVLTARRCG